VRQRTGCEVLGFLIIFVGFVLLKSVLFFFFEFLFLILIIITTTISIILISIIVKEFNII